MRKYDFHIKFIQNSINIIDYSNTITEKTHTIISIDTEKVLHEFQHFFYARSTQVVGLEENFLSFHT